VGRSVSSCIGEGQHIRPLSLRDPDTGLEDPRRVSILVDYKNLYIRVRTVVTLDGVWQKLIL